MIRVILRSVDPDLTVTRVILRSVNSDLTVTRVILRSVQTRLDLSVIDFSQVLFSRLKN